MAVSKKQVLAYLEPDEPDYASAAELGADVLPILDELLDDERPGIAAKAASLAGMVGGDKAVAVLQKAGESADPVVRVAAAGASSSLSATQAAKVLTPLVQDQDVGVQKTALNAAPPKLPSALRKTIEKIDPSTADPAIVALSQRALGVKPDAADEEEMATYEATPAVVEEMPTGDMEMGGDEMPSGDMDIAGDQMSVGDMPTDPDGGMASTEDMV